MNRALLKSLLILTVLLTAWPPSAFSKPIRHQVTGLFSTDREEDLRVTVEKIPGIKLVRIDFKNAEATLDYDPAQLLPKVKPEEMVKTLDNMVRGASAGTFGIKPLRTTPLDKLKLIEIPVTGLDCKACSLVAYESIYNIEGVELATASFRDGKVTAWIDADKTDRAKLEAALKMRGVQLKSR
jgi:copper chaperone CopZ